MTAFVIVLGCVGLMLFLVSMFAAGYRVATMKAAEYMMRREKEWIAGIPKLVELNVKRAAMLRDGMPEEMKSRIMEATLESVVEGLIEGAKPFLKVKVDTLPPLEGDRPGDLRRLYHARLWVMDSNHENFAQFLTLKPAESGREP